MSDYTYSTDFGAKDALNTGDPNKLIKGVDFDTEFNAISTAIATKADSNSSAVTLGSGAVSSGGGGTDFYNIAIGDSASAIGTAGIAIGRQASVANSVDNAVAIGIGSGVGSSGNNAIAIGRNAEVNGTDQIAIGNDSGNTGTNSETIAIGSNAGSTSQGSGSIAIGKSTNSSGLLSVVLGSNARASAQYGTALGTNALANIGSYNTALGYNAIAASYATAVNQANASGQRSVAVGHGAATSGPDSVAIGYSAAARGAAAVGIGNLAGADTDNVLHINASGVATNQPNTAGHMVIETDDAKIEYNGNWDLSSGDLTVNGGVEIGTNWKVRDNGSGVLIFSTGGTDKMKLDASGNLTVVGNVTAFGTI